MNQNHLIKALLAGLSYDPASDPGPALAGLTPADWGSLAELAETKRVAPLLYHKLAQRGLKRSVPRVALEQLRQRYRENTLKNLKFQSELSPVIAALVQGGIPVVILKGAYLAAAVYENLGLREMNDLDVLVKKTDLHRARQTLLPLGYQNIASDTPSASYQHLPPLQKPGAVSRVEIHWTIIPDTSPYRIDLAGLWQRIQPQDILEASGWTLSAEDLVLHTCLHAAYQHNMVFGLRPLCDLAEIIEQAPPDWEILQTRAKQWGCRRVLYLTMYFTRELLDAAVPESWLAQFTSEPLAPEVLAFARTQILGAAGETVNLSHNFVQMYGQRSLPDKLQTMARSLFLPPHKLGQIYGLPDNSIRIWFYYPRRAWDLLTRYGPSAQNTVGNTALSQQVTANNAFLAWLSEK